MVFFGEIHVLLELSCIYLFGAKRAYVHLESPKWQEVFLSNRTKFSQGNNVLDAPSCNTHGFLSRDVFVSSM
jgi:hypothetical protein